MNQKTFNIVVGIIFSAVFALHVLRLVNQWIVSIGAFEIPLWVSWVGIAVSGFLAFTALKNVKRQN